MKNFQVNEICIEDFSKKSIPLCDFFSYLIKLYENIIMKYVFWIKPDVSNFLVKVTSFFFFLQIT